MKAGTDEPQGRPPKVFGIGWPKTGTKTLGACMEILGFRHQSGPRMDLVGDLMRGDIASSFEAAALGNSFDDWPWIILFEDCDSEFPGSKFILTERDAEAYVRSYLNMVKGPPEPDPELTAARSFLYNLDFPEVTEDRLVERYLEHNREVKNFFKDRPNDLLVVNWAKGDGWEKLCNFLNKEIPNMPFPHRNRGFYAAVDGYRSSNDE